jgi:hypothetical protein
MIYSIMKGHKGEKTLWCLTYGTFKIVCFLSQLELQNSLSSYDLFNREWAQDRKKIDVANLGDKLR